MTITNLDLIKIATTLRGIKAETSAFKILCVRNLKTISKHLQEYQEQIEIINLDNCSEIDEKTDKLKFNKEGKQKAREAIKELSIKEVEVDIKTIQYDFIEAHENLNINDLVTLLDIIIIEENG